MKAQYFALGLLPSVVPPTAADATVLPTILFAFGDVNTGPNVTATQTGEITTITSTNTPVPIEFVNGNPFGGEGIYNLTATSVGAATPLFSPGEFVQDYSGSFSITGDGGFNYLSATFSESLLGIDASANVINENQLQFSRFGGEGSFHFTSDVSGLASSLNEDDQQIYFLGFFDANPLVGITDGTFSSFTANGTGNFSSTGPAMATPEPSTYAMMLIGFVGLGYAGLRKARAKAAFV
jgi:hypothetical protein